ncbi:transcription factor MYB120-like [Portunus trituberculatus]|uniref:transcription factor MYB120-like n=1 Tax=Portunus trituberculatus TaxID=210409 RepID=UPI001E1D083F|nr:transcription factor MYB120-like [Portunus trituberculatus]
MVPPCGGDGCNPAPHHQHHHHHHHQSETLQHQPQYYVSAAHLPNAMLRPVSSPPYPRPHSSMQGSSAVLNAPDKIRETQDSMTVHMRCSHFLITATPHALLTHMSHAAALPTQPSHDHQRPIAALPPQ